MKILITLFLFLCGFLSLAQVGINTITPQGTLDIVTTNNTGLVLPRVDSIEDVTDGAGGPPVNGTVVYDISRSTTCFYQNDAWTCIDSDALVDPVVTFDTCTTTFIKASNTGERDFFGLRSSLSGDGNTLVVSGNEDSNATGINGDQTDNSANDSGAVYIFFRVGGVWSQQAYIKASNTNTGDLFGSSVSLSEDGNTLAVGANVEDSNATGINGVQTNNSSLNSGAAYVFTRAGGVWSQQAYIKASNTNTGDLFGRSVSLSGDGNILAVGASRESSNAIGVNGDQNNNNSPDSGAAYIFNRTGGVWSQEAYIKASNTDTGDFFGTSIFLSKDGATLAVGAHLENSNATGINGDQTNNNTDDSGAVYVYTESGGVWSQEAYIKASNPDFDDRFGLSISLSGDGNTLAVGATNENSNTIGINGDQTNNSIDNSGAVYLFARTAGIWSQEAYIKASNTGLNDRFGTSVSLTENGNTLAVGAFLEASNARCINGNQTNNSSPNSGAAYIFNKAGGVWFQQAYIKATNTVTVGTGDNFGASISLSSNGDTLAVGGFDESSNAVGIDGDQNNDATDSSGAVYVYDN